MSRFQLKMDKNVGKVVYIVEGPKAEFQTLKKIYGSFLDYNLVLGPNNTDKISTYKSKTNKYSTVYIINAEQSELEHIKPGNEYLENLLQKLMDDYGLSISDASVYFLYDRDPENNTNTKLVQELLTTYRNSLDNGIELQGVLLLSYPSFESFILSCFENNVCDLAYKLGSEVKQHCHHLNINAQRITEEGLSNAISELYLATKSITDIEVNYDDLSNFNLSVFIKQEQHYRYTKKYRLLSLVMISLLDLGLIEILDDDS